MKTCKSCGAELSDDMAYCPKCGTHVDNEASPEQQNLSDVSPDCNTPQATANNYNNNNGYNNNGYNTGYGNGAYGNNNGYNNGYNNGAYSNGYNNMQNWPQNNNGYGYNAPNNYYAPTAGSQHSGLRTTAKVFMIITLAFSALFAFIYFFIGIALVNGGLIVYGACCAISLAWIIPMLVVYCKKCNRGEPVSTGFKVCTLIFVNVVSGILMLCDHQ